ncbi:MAG: redox-regulated ATPase YchF [Candidatus Margulisiibacteriota bacterium]
MSLKIGIVGLPNVGKSTLFNCLTKAHAEVSNYPFTTINPNLGIVEVPDERLVNISKIMKSQKTIPTTIEFVDIAGLVKGASRGEGLGNKFLANIREVDAIAHVVRCFDSPSVAHVEGVPGPIRDIETVNSELLLSDLATIEKKLSELQRLLKSNDKAAQHQAGVFKKAQEAVGKGSPLSSASWSDEEKSVLGPLFLLTMKPQIIVTNTDEKSFVSGRNGFVKEAESAANTIGAPLVEICSKLEEEILELSKEEAAQYLAEIGIKELRLQELIKTGYKTLDLITFFTGNEKETRAWTATNGTKLVSAAGKIHTDMEKGFISAEVISAEELINMGTYAHAKENGAVRLEGKEYFVKDGDLVYVRFNV